MIYLSNNMLQWEGAGAIELEFLPDGAVEFCADNGLNYEDNRTVYVKIPADQTDDFFAALEELIEHRFALTNNAKSERIIP